MSPIPKIPKLQKTWWHEPRIRLRQCVLKWIDFKIEQHDDKNLESNSETVWSSELILRDYSNPH